MAAVGDVRRRVLLTPGQVLHERLMREVLKRVCDIDMVLRGGTALAFAYGVDRHSIDLDFDAHGLDTFRARVRRAG